MNANHYIINSYQIQSHRNIVTNCFSYINICYLVGDATSMPADVRERKKERKICKPDSVFPKQGEAVIYLAPEIPKHLATHPGVEKRTVSFRIDAENPLYLVLHRIGFTCSQQRDGELLPRLFTSRSFPELGKEWSFLCGTFHTLTGPSLSTRYPVLWCPDFPL